MPTHAEKRALPYTPRQLFDLVADIDRYPEFLPWCVAARAKNREGDKLIAEIVIGYKMLRERFITEDVLTFPDGNRPGRIDISFREGPFHTLRSHWIFEPDGQGGCVIDFFIDFEFKTPILQRIIGAVFNEAAQYMVGAFEKRAIKVYGAAVRER